MLALRRYDMYSQVLLQSNKNRKSSGMVRSSPGNACRNAMSNGWTGLLSQALLGKRFCARLLGSDCPNKSKVIPRSNGMSSSHNASSPAPSEICVKGHREIAERLASQAPHACAICRPTLGEHRPLEKEPGK